MFCPQCGKEIEESSKFCRFCGSSVVHEPDLPIAADVLPQDADSPNVVLQDENVQSSTNFEESTRPQENNIPQETPSGDSSKKKRNIIIGTIGAIAIIMVAVIAYTGTSNNTDPNNHHVSDTGTEDDLVIFENMEIMVDGCSWVGFYLDDNWPADPNESFAKSFTKWYGGRQVFFFGFVPNIIQADDNRIMDNIHDIVIEDEYYAKLYDSSDVGVVFGTVQDETINGCISVKVDYYMMTSSDYYFDPVVQRRVHGRPVRAPRIPEVDTVDEFMQYGINWMAYASTTSSVIPTFYADDWPGTPSDDDLLAFQRQFGGYMVRMVGAVFDGTRVDTAIASNMDMALTGHNRYWNASFGIPYIVEGVIEPTGSPKIDMVTGEWLNVDITPYYPTAEYWLDEGNNSYIDPSNPANYKFIDPNDYKGNRARATAGLQDGDLICTYGKIYYITSTHAIVSIPDISGDDANCSYDAQSSGIYNFNEGDTVWVYGIYEKANSTLIINDCEFFSERLTGQSSSSANTHQEYLNINLTKYW